MARRSQRVNGRRRFDVLMRPIRRWVPSATAEVLPWAGCAGVLGAIGGALIVFDLCRASDLGPAVVVARLILGAVAGGLSAGFAATCFAVEPIPRTTAGPAGDPAVELWDPWLDSGPGEARAEAVPVEWTGPAPAPARVRPRAISAEGGESLPLVDQVLPLLRGREPGVVGILGPIGSGKSTALRHLERMLPAHAAVTLLDDPAPDSVGVAAVGGGGAGRGLVIYASSAPAAPTIHLANFRLAPWGDDELIEYLLAEGHETCASVMGRLKRDASRSRLGGNPELWGVVLERMIADRSVATTREALRIELAALMPDPEHRSNTRWLCLERLVPGVVVGAPREPVERADPAGARLARLSRHRPVQVLLASEELVERLAGGLDRLEFLEWKLPRDLVSEAGSVVATNPAALGRLLSIVEAKADARLQPMAASLLHATGIGWKPAEGAVPRLSGAYLEGASWAGAPLENAQMHGSGLADADLSRAALDSAVLHRANLSRANLRGASLRRAHLECADLSRANLARSIAHGADFTLANLAGANLQGAVLESAQLVGACLAGANCSRANFSKADLDRADIEGADFRGANLDAARLSDLTLATADFAGASFAGANLSRCDLEGMALPGVNLRGAHLHGALLTGTTMPGANFQGACLRDAGLADVSWEGVCLRDADLRGASFHAGSTRNGLVGSPIACEGSRTGFYTDDSLDQSFKAPEEVRKADLRGADLRGAALEGVDFYLVDLRGALFDPTDAPRLRASGAILEMRNGV